MAIFKITVTQTDAVKPCVSALYVASGTTALITACTVNGIIEGAGTNIKKSTGKLTVAVALPSTPVASV